ncbi:MAG TPA: FAD/NAD(P)-binding oxidoreductase [Solirubrobacterales bacterium]|nr:FAD/NAD(P)-binding oxidoreductase [Solirubrobacterales bacterium]
MKNQVLVAGGGVAALEAALALDHLAGDLVEVTICSPRRDFVYRPYSVGVPYGVSRVVTYDLERLATAARANYRSDSIASVNREARLAVTHDGESLPYGDLIVCPGTKLYWPVPGAITFWGIADERDVGKVMAEIREGRAYRIAFTMPAVESWALPLYELALLARAELDRTGDDAELTIVTPEDAPLQVFGRGVAEGMAELLAEHRIKVITGAHPVRLEHGQLETVPAGPLSFDKVISLPKLEGRRIRGVPHDLEGFVHVDSHCKVLGCDHEYAAGDVTGYPVKQGGLATQQADVAAAAIAARLGADVEAPQFDPILRGVLWTGSGTRYLQGWLAGGHGETSTMTEAPPWGSDQGKIVGRYLTEFLAGVAA